jgi:4-diphosphocytidyl-2-C-methyl-D-erythritol kinase
VAIRHSAIRVFAPAKINLLLHVIGRRADGYHDLQSLVAFADIGDTIALDPADDLALSLEGPFGAGLSGEMDNLVLKAARKLADRFGISNGARITLTKELPVASGIGGGSADAAATIRGLLSLWGKHVEESALNAIAAEIGSDVPVCLASRAAWMEGRGETLTMLPELPSVGLVLINPGVGIATAEVFGRLKRSDRRLLEIPREPFASLNQLLQYLRATENDLQTPAGEIAPIVGDAIDGLSGAGAAFARMSGSGATCFGLFETVAQAKIAEDRLSAARPQWWVRSGKFANGLVALPQSG